MSDFDDVLERLLTDPAFKTQLAADPARALAGYRLSADELDLLQAQVGGDLGGQSQVEQRTSKASMFGLFSSIGAGITDVVHGHGVGAAGHGLGHGLDHVAAGRHGTGLDAAHTPSAPPEQSGGFGLARHLDAVDEAAHGHGGVTAQAGPGGAVAAAGGVEAHAGAGITEASYADQGPSAGIAEAPDASSQGTVYRSGTVYASSGIAEAPDGGYPASGIAEAPDGQDGAYGTGGLHAAEGGGGAGRHGLGGLLDAGQPGAGGDAGGQTGQYQGSHRSGLGGLLGEDRVQAAARPHAPTDGYHTRVDWDGDGKWDQHTYVERPDGGVDIVVDVDGDGRAEFVGHDTDRDGLINSSEIDTNHDGVMDARYEDLNGDGWLDRRTR